MALAGTSIIAIALHRYWRDAMNRKNAWIAGIVLACSAVIGQAAQAECGIGLCTIDRNKKPYVYKTWAGTNATWGSFNSRADYFWNRNGRATYACIYGSTNYRGSIFALPRGGALEDTRNWGSSNRWYSNAQDCF